MASNSDSILIVDFCCSLACTVDFGFKVHVRFVGNDLSFLRMIVTLHIYFKAFS